MRRAVEEILTESADDDYEGDPGCFGGENRAAPIPESSLGLIFGTTNVSGTRAPQGGMFAQFATSLFANLVAHKRGETRVAQLQRELGEVRNSQEQSAKGIADAECARGSAQATIVDLKEQIRTARERFAKVKLERSSFERRLETDQSDVAELQIEKAKQEQDYLKRIADLESAWKLSEEG